MMNLKTVSGIIFAVLGVIGMGVTMFGSSPAVTPLYTLIGVAGFFVLFMYGLNKALATYFQAERDFQINS